MDKTVKLPSAKEIVARMETAQLGLDERVAGPFNQALVKLAGQKMSAYSLVRQLIVIINEFSNTTDYGLDTFSVLYLCIPQIVDALVDDKDIASEAHLFLKEVNDEQMKFGDKPKKEEQND